MDQLPQETLHPLHPHHGLLSLRSRYNYTCKLCGKEEERALSFQCPQCDFQLCVKCGVRKGTVNYKHHGHLLCFVEKTYSKLGQCSAYDTNCKLSVVSNCNEFDITSSSIFRCLDCDFRLHFLCGPRPYIIKHECHIDPLILVDSIIEDASGEYFCDVCETRRHPRLRIYYRDKCKSVAHVHCVISEIINVRKGDLGNLKLKIVGEEAWTSTKEIDKTLVLDKVQCGFHMTLGDLIYKQTTYELRLLRKSYYWDEENRRKQKLSQTISQRVLGDADIDELLRISTFTEMEFNSFVKFNLRYGISNRKPEINSSDLALKIVDVQGYSIPFTLVSDLKNLLHKCRDISEKSKSSPARKSIIFFFLCHVMKKVHTILLTVITKNLLQDWYCHVKFAHKANFEVEFLEASLEGIARAFFYPQVRKN